MTVVSAFLVPGSPLPYVQRDNPPWGLLASAMENAGAALAASKPETIVVYSTQWLAVLDQLWLTRPHVSGLHVDENWHEYGDLPFDIHIDTELTSAIVAVTPSIEIRSKGVDYDAFPVDTGTIVAANFLDPGGTRQMTITSNNLYHDWTMTHGLGRLAAEQADRLGRRIAVVGVGGLSGSAFRETIDIASDHIATPSDDAWNRKVLKLMETGDAAELINVCPQYAAEAKVDMGFKHCGFVLGALGGEFKAATIHGYGPLYGAGGAVVEFHI
jgi:2-aminophenol/2-amino-5-chlorophenol 1,6-dioxygenase alpha subunit